MWEQWRTGRSDWDGGQIKPDEVLYYLNGPAIFLCRIGLENYLFFKSDEHAKGDYYIASAISEREITALKSGNLSVRGALSQPKCWFLETDFDLNVVRYEIFAEAKAAPYFPRSGVALSAAAGTAPDSLTQTDALFAFKFYGDEMSEEGMPFSTFKNLVDRVYNVVKNALVPTSLSAGRDRRFIDFPLRPPEFASLLIAIDNPSIDTSYLNANDRTRLLDPESIAEEAQARGRNFVDQVERTIELAMSDRMSEQFAADNYEFLQHIIEILPSSRNELSKLQFSSTSKGETVFIEIDEAAGDRIRDSVNVVERRTIYIQGVVTAVLWKSKTVRLQTNFGREVTCQLGVTQFDDLIRQGRLKIGERIGFDGRYTKRDLRDFMKVEGDPTFIQ